MSGESETAVGSTATNSTTMGSKLVDIEWNIGVTAASSNEESSGRTFLHFKMLMQNNSGKPETVHLELAPSDFYRLLHEMERAKNNLEILVGSSSTS